MKKKTSIGEVILQVKRSILSALSQSKSKLLLENCQIKLITEIVRERGGGMGIKVPIIESEITTQGRINSTDVQVITLDLEPVKERGLYKIPEFKSELTEAIVSIEEGLKGTSEGELKFRLNKVIIELKFIVNREGKIGFVFGGKNSSNITNVVKLTLSEQK